MAITITSQYTRPTGADADYAQELIKQQLEALKKAMEEQLKQAQQAEAAAQMAAAFDAKMASGDLAGAAAVLGQAVGVDVSADGVVNTDDLTAITSALSTSEAFAPIAGPAAEINASLQSAFEDGSVTAQEFSLLTGDPVPQMDLEGMAEIAQWMGVELVGQPLGTDVYGYTVQGISGPPGNLGSMPGGAQLLATAEQFPGGSWTLHTNANGQSFVRYDLPKDAEGKQMTTASGTPYAEVLSFNPETLPAAAPVTPAVTAEAAVATATAEAENALASNESLEGYSLASPTLFGDSYVFPLVLDASGGYSDQVLVVSPDGVDLRDRSDFDNLAV